LVCKKYNKIEADEGRETEMRDMNEITLENLKTMRQRLGRTQIEFAKMAGVSLFCYQLWEKGVSVPKESNWQRLIDATRGLLSELDNNGDGR